MTWHTTLASTLAENNLLQRLCFATLELLLLSLLLALVLKLARFSSQRLVACLWLIVLVKPLFTLAAGAPIALFEYRVPALELTHISRAPDASKQPITHHAAASPGIASTTETPPIGPLTKTADNTDTLTPTPTSNATTTTTLRVEVLLLALWGAGVAWCAARYALARLRLSRMVRRSALAPAPALRMYATIAREAGLARIPALRIIDDLDSPALVGLLQPTVLLPRRLVDHHDAASTQWALRHELAHWRWLDPLAILVRDCASIVFFFHPLLPWAVRRHAEAMEMACDWESLRDPSEAAEYAEGLCGILVLMRERPPQQIAGSTLAMATHGRMVRRIRALLDGERARPLTPQSAVSVLLVAVAVFALGCRVGRDEGQSSEPQPTAATAPVPQADDDKATGRAILEGLRWLVRHQNADGSWSPTTIAELCPCEDPIYKPKEAYTKRYDEGLTGLALLCFLGAGFTDKSPSHDGSSLEVVDTVTGKRYRLADIVGNGLRWLVQKQKPDGSFGAARPFMYSEAMAAMALTKAYGMTQSNEWKEPAQRALDFIQSAQRPSPPKGEGLWGWRYASRQEVEQFARGKNVDEMTKAELYLADSSVTGWCTMVLASGRAAGLEVDEANMQGALAFTKAMTGYKGMVGYISAKGAGATVTGPGDHYVYHPTAMSALGICTRMFTEHNSDDPFLDLAAQQLAKDLPIVSEDKLSIDYYYWYYGTLALSQVDGPDARERTNKYFGPWKKETVAALLALQDKTPKACTHGGWMVPDRWSREAGPIYTTAMNLLTLEVDYRPRSARPQSK